MYKFYFKLKTDDKINRKVFKVPILYIHTYYIIYASEILFLFHLQREII